MISSGIKRGLAVSAVSALAVVGLPMTAGAQTVAQGLAGGPLELYSQYSGGMTTLNDGANETVTLFAGVPASIGGTPVNAVKFSYLKGGTQVDIQTVVAVDGVATMQWTPPAGAEGAAITGIRAEALDNGGTTLGAPVDRAATLSNAAGIRAAHLNGALRSEVGIGPDGEIVVTGTTTDSAANTDVEARGPEAVVAEGTAGTDGTPAVPTTVGTPNSNGISNFTAVVPVGANDTADAVDEIVVGVDVTGSDDVNAYSAYKQTVTAANVSPSSASVQAGGVDNVSTYTITVTDQKGAAVQGLDIYESNAAGAADTSANGGTVNPANGAYVAGDEWETGADGKFVASLRESDIDNGDDQDGNTGNNTQTAYFVVDVNQNGAYDNGVDYRFQVTQAKVAAVPTTVEITSAKGNAIDDDETTQITVLVKDQNGAPIQGVTPVVAVTSVDKDANPDATATTPAAVGPTDADGKTTFNLTGRNGATVDFTVNAFVNNNGTPQPDAGDAIATPFKIASDTSHIEWDNGTTAQAQNGTTTTQSGVLVLDESETPLPGRTIAIDYAANDNSILAAQAQQPAGTTRGSDTTASATTDANGKFSVAVTDPATPNGEELGSELTAQAPALDVNGVYGGADSTPVGDLANYTSNDDTDAVLDVDFLRSLTPASLRIVNGATSDTTDGLDPVVSPTGELVPGGLGAGWVEARNADGRLLTDLEVTLTIDEGNFVNPRSPFEPTPAPGAPVDFGSIGKSLTMKTDDDGEAVFLANIERNEGFDDDGEVDDKINATAGGASDSHDLTWTTNGTPINPRATDPLVVELSEDQESTILPKARAGDAFGGSGQLVDYDVQTFDQFGNPTSQDINVTDNTPLAGFETDDESKFALGQPAISAWADEATSQSLEVELDGAIRVVYADDPADSSFDPANPGASLVFSDADIEQDTDAIQWYDVNFAASTFTLDNEGQETVPVGTTVTEVLTATDQEGQVIEGMFVDFLRGGPGDEDSDGNNGTRTDNAGQAFYDFVGGTPGEATVTAVIYDDNGNRLGRVGPDTVTFKNDGGVVSINLKATGKSKGNKDKITANANKNGAGLVAKVFKNGKKVAQHKLNAQGNFTFSVKDTNGKKKTKYVVRVAKTATTNKAQDAVTIK